MGRRTIPDMSELEQWLRSGLTPKQASERYAARGDYVTPGAIALARHRNNWPRVNLDHSELIPWHIEPEHRRLYDHRMLTEESSRRQGKSLTAEYARLVETWKKRLEAEGAVIHYDPLTEQGWWHVPRRPGIDTDLIRVPSDEDLDEGIRLRV